jgi:hypothetical protein
MICEGMFIKSEAKFCSCKQFAKFAIKENTEPLSSQKVGLESGQPRVIGLGYFIMPFRMGNC